VNLLSGLIVEDQDELVPPPRHVSPSRTGLGQALGDVLQQLVAGVVGRAVVTN